MECADCVFSVTYVAFSATIVVNSDNYVRCNDNAESAEKYVLDYCGIVGSVGSVCLESKTRRRMARNELRKCLRNGNFNLIISDLKNHFRKKKIVGI